MTDEERRERRLDRADKVAEAARNQAERTTLLAATIKDTAGKRDGLRRAAVLYLERLEGTHGRSA